MGAAVTARGLGKKYRMYPTPWSRILEWASLGRHETHRAHWALRDIDFTVGEGRVLGVMGANGAGKSTLLKILAGTTQPTEGSFQVEGRVASLLELGAGFHQDFTGRDNVYLNGALMGYTRREMADRIGPILDFAELGAYVDEPVRTYSSGMAMRLGFSVAIAVDPDVMIVDEVFSVGDMYFQKKCVDRIYEFKNAGKTMVFCSHSLYDIRQLCDEAVWIKDGRIESRGDAISVTNDYAAFERSLGADASEVVKHLPEAPDRGPRPRIVSAQVCRGGTREPMGEAAPGDAVDVVVRWENPDPAATPVHIGVGFLRNDSTLCCADSTEFALEDPLPGKSGTVIHRVPRVLLLSGTFQVFAVLFDEKGIHRYDEQIVEQPLVVLNRGKDVGLFLQDHQWIVESD